MLQKKKKKKKTISGIPHLTRYEQSGGDVFSPSLTTNDPVCR